MENGVINHQAILELAAQIKGDVLTPGDPGYASASQPWDRTIKQEPALVVRAADRDDVMAAVGFANRMHLQISVINTGHGVAEPANNALLLNVSRMRSVRVDPASGTAWLEAGATWRDVLIPAQAAGFAPPMGSTSGIGAVGFTLLGGIGWLSRQFGLALDHVISFDFVTAAGELLHVSDSENPDLFWALRGAGAAFGVVTAMEISLLPVRSVFAGSIVYPPEMIAEVLFRYREWLQLCEPLVGDRLTTSLLIGNFPDLDSLPTYLRSHSAIIVRGCLVGTAEEGANLLRHWRDWKPPLADDFREMPFTEIDSISLDPSEPQSTFISNVTLREFSDDLIQALLRHTLSKGKPPMLSITDLRQAGGAISRVPADATAFGQREAAFVLTMIAVASNEVTAAAFATATDRIKSEIHERNRSGVYLNFLNGPDKWVLTPDAFPPDTYRRLNSIKQHYDPDNRFSFSLDILPLTEACCQL